MKRHDTEAASLKLAETLLLDAIQEELKKVPEKADAKLRL